MDLEVLSPAQVEEFTERGWTQLEAAYAREDALAAQDFMWDKVGERGVQREDRATWTSHLVHIAENYDTPAFQACNTSRLKGAIEDLVGRGRWKKRDEPVQWGWWPVNFPRGAEAEWDVWPRGWHWDGQHFRHYLNSPNQGILLICCFSDINPRGGGTFVAAGSHKLVVRYLAQKPDGVELGDGIRECNAGHPWLADLSGTGSAKYSEDAPDSRVERFMERHWTDADGTELWVDEVTCKAGDVILCHPFLYHSVSANLAGEPRFMCNRTTEVREPLELERPDGDYSVLEESLRRALGTMVA